MEKVITFTDWCCGIGGTRQAIEEAAKCEGYTPRCLVSADKDKYCQVSYKENFGNEDMLGSPHEVDPKVVPNHNILSAGFPCQPFSLAGVSKKNSLGRPHGFDDPTSGTVFFSLLKIIKQSLPDVVFLENVKGLRTHDKGRTLQVIVDSLIIAGYFVVKPEIFDTKKLLPQHRERLFIIAFKDKEKFNKFCWPTIEDRGPRLKNILENYVDSKYTLSDKMWNFLQGYKLKHTQAGHGFGYGLADLEGITRTLSSRYYKDGSEILIPQGEGKNPRRLTPRECARLQGFPDSYKIVVSDTQAYKQFGNSVPIPLLTEIVRCIMRTFNV